MLLSLISVFKTLLNKLLKNQIKITRKKMEKKYFNIFSISRTEKFTLLLATP